MITTLGARGYARLYLLAGPQMLETVLRDGALSRLYLTLTHQVIGWEGHRAYLGIVTLALAGNIGANIMLVPERGLVGAAIATVLTEIVVTVGCLFVLRAKRVLVGGLSIGARP